MLMLSLMKRTEPSPIRTFTPPEWKLEALEKMPSSTPQPPQPTRQELNLACAELGVTTVLNRVWAMAPQPQRLPTLVCMFVPAFDCVEHAWIAASTLFQVVDPG